MTNTRLTLETIGFKPGYDKSGQREACGQITFSRGNTYALVGQTGAGKSQVLEDIATLAQGDSITRRQILIDGAPPTDRHFSCLRSHLVAHLSQSMRFVLDLTIAEFLTMRGPSVDRVLRATNQLAGEALHPHQKLTALSGGQTRALMVADVAYNSPAPVVLLDELENAGINRTEALRLLTSQEKIVLLVTHDPLLALYGKYRLIVKKGGIAATIQRSAAEGQVYEDLLKNFQGQEALRQQLRGGLHVSYLVE